MKIERFLFLGFAVLAIAVGCSGRGTGLMPLPSKPAAAQMTTAVFTMHWPTAPPAGVVRQPMYISPNTESVSVSVNGGTAQVVNKPTPPAASSNVTIDAPVGTDTFVFKLFDQFNGAGNVLSTTTITQQIVAGQANVINATLNGVVTKIVLSLPIPTPPAGTPTSEPLNVAAYDADDNVIVGPGGYDRQILLSDSDGTGATSIDHTTVTGPGTPVVTLTYNGHNVWSALFNATANGVSGGHITPATFKPTLVIDEFAMPGPLPSGRQGPAGITVGTDNNLWVTDFVRGSLLRVTTAGSAMEFPVPSQTSSPAPLPGVITTGPDGNLWFVEQGRNAIGTSTVGGSMIEYPIPVGSATPAGPVAITTGPDGNLWFVLQSPSGVGSITTGGTISLFPVTASLPQIIATGPDRQLWFGAEAAGGKIMAFPPGNPTFLSVFTPPDAAAGQVGMTAGPDGAMWFTEAAIFGGVPKIGRITTGGSITEFGPLTANSVPALITVGPDGALWFTEAFGSAIGRITTSGDIAEIPVTLSSQPFAIVSGPDGNIWFTESIGNKVARLKF